MPVLADHLTYGVPHRYPRLWRYGSARQRSPALGGLDREVDPRSAGAMRSPRGAGSRPRRCGAPAEATPTNHSPVQLLMPWNTSAALSHRLRVPVRCWWERRPAGSLRAGYCTSTVRCLRPRPWCLLEIAACPMRRPVPDTQARLPCWRPLPLISPPAGLEAACGGTRWKSCSDCRTTSTSTLSPPLATLRTGSLQGSASPQGWRRLGPESRLRLLLRV